MENGAEKLIFLLTYLFIVLFWIIDFARRQLTQKWFNWKIYFPAPSALILAADKLKGIEVKDEM